MSLPAALTIGAGLLAVWAVWAIVRIALYFKSRELTIGRAYAISYLLLLPLLLCLLLELAGGFTDGSDKTPEYLVVLAIAPLANLQLGFVTWIWMKVYGTRAEHPRQWLRVISHFLYTLPFLIPLARLGLFVGTALMTKPGHRDSNGLLFLVAANIAFWLWRKKLRSARPIAR
ncbi:MAG TPA: hypothetical protein PKK31_05975 [Elusimicrobiales bacterium]|nr:hypothetical protein [Elusimicrobiales bacterium]